MNPIRIYTVSDFPEIRKEIKAIGYNYCRLATSEGKSLIGWNSTRTKGQLDGPLNNILKRLQSAALKPDNYIIECKNTQMTKNEETDKFIVTNLPPEQAGSSTQMFLTPPPAPGSVGVLSWEQAIEYNNQITRLGIDNNRLVMENEALEARIEILEAELEEFKASGENKTLADKAMGFLERNESMLAPLVLRWFDQRDKVLKIREIEAMALAGYEYEEEEEPWEFDWNKYQRSSEEVQRQMEAEWQQKDPEGFAQAVKAQQQHQQQQQHQHQNGHAQ